MLDIKLDALFACHVSWSLWPAPRTCSSAPKICCWRPSDERARMLEISRARAKYVAVATSFAKAIGGFASSDDRRSRRPATCQYQTRRLCRHFFSSPPLPPDVPRTPGIRPTETQSAVSRHPAAEISGLSRGHPSRGTYSHSVNTSGSRVLRVRRSTRSKAPDGPSCYCRFSGGSIASASHIEPRAPPVFPQPFIPAQYTWKFGHIAICYFGLVRWLWPAPAAVEQSVCGGNARGLRLALRHDLDQRRDRFWPALARELPYLRDNFRPAAWVPD